MRINKLERWGLAGAVIGALFASACCTVPLLLLAFGISGAAFAGFFEQYRPIFLLFTFTFLVAAFYFTYRPRRSAGDCGGEAGCNTSKVAGQVRKANRVILWAVTLIVLGLALFPNYAGSLLGGTGEAEPAAVGPDSVHVVIRIEGMTCDACAATLRTRLVKIPGVESVVVDYESASATLYQSPDGPTDDALKHAVEDVGFRLTSIQTESP